MINRRSAIAIASAGLVLSGCVAEGIETASPPVEVTEKPSEARTVPAMPANRLISPQVVFGRPSAPSFTEAAVSLHCGATRAFTANVLRNRIDDARAGRRLVVLSHYVRTQNEIPVGIEMLQTGDRYPEALLALLGLSARVGRALSATEASQFLSGAGFVKNPRIRADDARTALGILRVTYDAVGLTETPFIREG